MIITKFKQSTGQITDVISLPENMVADNIFDGESYVVGEYDLNDYLIIDGKPTKKPHKPSEFHSFDYLTGLWSINESGLEAIRHKRNQLLADSDWTQLPDVPEQTRLKWQAYRQALRDITLQDGFPENIIWPEMPE